MAGIIVVPGGFGPTFLPHLGGESSRVIPGGHRGEAAVDFIICSDENVLAIAVEHVSIPVIAALALVTVADAHLDSLRESVQHSDHWSAALGLVRRWHGGSWASPVFRATALRDDGVAQPKVNDIARSVASGVFRRWSWAVSMSAYDVEVCAIWLASGRVLVGIPLTPGWHACVRVAKGGFFPIETFPGVAPSASSSGEETRGSPSQPVLRPSVCHGLLLRSGIRSTDLMCDTMCGVGSLPAEALTRFGLPYALAGDNGRNATREAGRRRRRLRRVSATLSLSGNSGGGDSGRSGGSSSGGASSSGSVTTTTCRVHLQLTWRAPSLEVARWDAKCLPLRSSVVDAIVVDVPWGNRGKAEPALLRETLSEVERVLTPGGKAVVLLVRASARALEERGLDGIGLKLIDSLDVCVGGWPVAAITLRKQTREQIREQTLPLVGLVGRTASVCAATTGVATFDAMSSRAAPPRVVLSSCCCTVEVERTLAPLNLAELLVAAFPSLVPSISNARRAVRHRRVCLAAAPTTVLWWRSCVPVGARVVLRPHIARMQPQEALTAMHEAEPLRVLWETDEWVAVVKPAGLGVLRGRRSLANALLALQASRGGGKAHTAGKTATGAADSSAAGAQQKVAAQQTAAAPAEPARTAEEGDAPWTVAYDGPSKLGGVWLAAKTAAAAVALLDGEVHIVIDWVAIFRGSPSEAALKEAGVEGAVAGRIGRSVRYDTISEVRFRTSSADLAAWRNAAAALGYPVVGDRPHCDGPAACLWVSAARVEPTSNQPAAGWAAIATMVDSVVAPAPERFARLFEREEQVCRFRDQGQITSEYVLRIQREQQEEGEEEEVVVDDADSAGEDDELEAEQLS